MQQKLNNKTEYFNLNENVYRKSASFMLSFTTVLILELYKIHLDIESIIILTWKYPYYYVFFFWNTLFTLK